MPLDGPEVPQDASGGAGTGVRSPGGPRPSWTTPAGRRRFRRRSWFPWTEEAQWRRNVIAYYEVAHAIVEEPPPHGHTSIEAYLVAVGIDRDPVALHDVLVEVVGILRGIEAAIRSGATGVDLAALIQEHTTL